MRKSRKPFRRRDWASPKGSRKTAGMIGSPRKFQTIPLKLPGKPDGDSENWNERRAAPKTVPKKRKEEILNKILTLKLFDYEPD